MTAIATTSFPTRREAVYRWDAIPCLMRLESQLQDKQEITRAIMDAYYYSVNIPLTDLPAISEDDATYVAVKDWLARGNLGVNYWAMSGVRGWLERWLEDSRNR